MSWSDYGIDDYLQKNTIISVDHKNAIIAALTERASVVCQTGYNINTIFTNNITKYTNQKVLTKEFRDWVIDSINIIMFWYITPDNDLWTYAYMPGDPFYTGSIAVPINGWHSQPCFVDWFNRVYDVINYDMQWISVRNNISFDIPYIIFDYNVHMQYEMILRNTSIEYDLIYTYTIINQQTGHIDYYYNNVVRIPGSTVAYALPPLALPLYYGAGYAKLKPVFDFTF
jgi:hypothetical protein